MSKQKKVKSGENPYKNSVVKPYTQNSESEYFLPWAENIVEEKLTGFCIVNYYSLENDIKHLTGKVLTILDASISDKQQNKAIKDLVKQVFSEYINTEQRRFFENESHSVQVDELYNKK